MQAHTLRFAWAGPGGAGENGDGPTWWIRTSARAPEMARLVTQDPAPSSLSVPADGTFLAVGFGARFEDAADQG
jgi:hypothetical protein